MHTWPQCAMTTLVHTAVQVCTTKPADGSRSYLRPGASTAGTSSARIARRSETDCCGRTSCRNRPTPCAAIDPRLSDCFQRVAKAARLAQHHSRLASGSSRVPARRLGRLVLRLKSPRHPGRGAGAAVRRDSEATSRAEASGAGGGTACSRRAHAPTIANNRETPSVVANL